jgi:hypothetical protein
MTDLIFVKILSNGLARYRCTRQRNGVECGNLRDLDKHSARLYRSCVECAELAKRLRVKKETVTFYNYQRVRANFTPSQLQRYGEILRGRKTAEDQKDAVELVILEVKNRLPDGVCCRACLRKIEAA